MKLLLALTYYRPHVSGLTIYVERLARSLVQRGHAVTVLTSQHRRSLPAREELEGVAVVRVPVRLRIGSGVVMPRYPLWAARLALAHDAINVHLPNFDAWQLAAAARMRALPCVATHHCDLTLPGGVRSRFIETVAHRADLLALMLADAAVTYTADYAAASPSLRRVASKVRAVLPPVAIPVPEPVEVTEFGRRHGVGAGVDRRPVLAFAGRFASEKGLETIIASFPALLREFPRLKLLFAGPVDEVAGEREYRRRLAPQIAALGEHWTFVGTLDSGRELAAFFATADCLLLPSTTRKESFGLVQAEAMLCGTPVVASDLPGVRQPVTMTSMGEVVPVRDPAALAAAVTRVLRKGEHYRRPRSEVEQIFDPVRTVDAYESLFEELVRAKRRISRL
jgi:glycosyltransferase involved in cell wall biosynthesis